MRRLLLAATIVVLTTLGAASQERRGWDLSYFYNQAGEVFAEGSVSEVQSSTGIKLVCTREGLRLALRPSGWRYVSGKPLVLRYDGQEIVGKLTLVRGRNYEAYQALSEADTTLAVDMFLRADGLIFYAYDHESGFFAPAGASRVILIVKDTCLPGTAGLPAPSAD